MLRLRHLLSFLGGHCERQKLVSNSVSAQIISLRCCKNFRWRFSRVNMPKWDKCDDSEIQLSTPHVDCDSCTKCQTSTRDGIIFDTKSRTHVYEMKNHATHGNAVHVENMAKLQKTFKFGKWKSIYNSQRDYAGSNGHTGSSFRFPCPSCQVCSRETVPYCDSKRASLRQEIRNH